MLACSLLKYNVIFNEKSCSCLEGGPRRQTLISDYEMEYGRALIFELWGKGGQKQ